MRDHRVARVGAGIRGCLVLGLAPLLCGCETYAPRPLDRNAVDSALASPDLSQLAALSRQHVHPLLPALTIDLDDGLDPTEAACLAVVLNPDLRAERAKRGVAAAQLVEAGILPNPQLVATVDWPSGGMTAGTIPAYGIGLGWDVSALIQHSANVEAARADDQGALLDLLWTEWQVASAARLAVTQAVWQKSMCRSLAAAVGHAEVALADLSRALESGEATALEVAASRSTLQAYLAQLRAAERAQTLAELEVKRAIGMSPKAELALAAPSDDGHAAVPSLDVAFAAARDARIDLAALRAGYDAQEARVRSEVLSQFPKLNIGVLAARDTSDVRTVGIGVSIDLPVFDRGQGRIAMATATREQLYEEYIAREFALRADLGTILAELEQLGPEIDTQASSLEAEEATLRIVEQDEEAQLVDILSVEQLRAEAVNARLTLLALRQRRAELRVAFEAASGALIDGGVQ